LRSGKFVAATNLFWQTEDQSERKLVELSAVQLKALSNRRPLAAHPQAAYCEYSLGLISPIWPRQTLNNPPLKSDCNPLASSVGKQQMSHVGTALNRTINAITNPPSTIAWLKQA
jgi:hypothetical protein